jgi:hypothetical protein
VCINSRRKDGGKIMAGTNIDQNISTLNDSSKKEGIIESVVSSFGNLKCPDFLTKVENGGIQEPGSIGHWSEVEKRVTALEAKENSNQKEIAPRSIVEEMMEGILTNQESPQMRCWQEIERRVTDLESAAKRKGSGEGEIAHGSIIDHLIGEIQANQKEPNKDPWVKIEERLTTLEKNEDNFSKQPA